MKEEANFPGITLLKQFVRSLSFERAKDYSQNQEKSLASPKVSIRISVDASVVSDGKYDTRINLSAVANDDNGSEIFSANCVYSGIFELKNVPKEDVEPLLLVYCPSIIFPFLRRIVSDITIDAGFPALMLDIVDFSRLYQDSRAEAKPEAK